MLSSQDDGVDDPPDLPAGQKMVSAISGSLLTALLGESLFLYFSIYLLCSLRFPENM